MSKPPPGPPACNEEKDQGSRMPPCPYDRIVTLYHEILPELPPGGHAHIQAQKLDHGTLALCLHDREGRESG